MKIMFLSDSPMLPTGYSNQAKQLARYLKNKGHEIHYLANAYNGADLSGVTLSDGTIFDYKIYGEMQQSYFSTTMSQRLKENKIDKFIILLDTFMLFQTGFLNQDTSPAETFFWFPSDGGGGMPKGCENVLRKVDKPVAMAQFGQKQCLDYYNIKTQYIPHGVDSKQFFRLPDNERNELRRKWSLSDKFVIGVVARNQPRKNLDRTIKSMALIKDKIPNAILFLHLDPNDPAQPIFNIQSLVQKYNLENRVVYSGMQAHKGFDQNKMNEVYNLMDCFLLTTSGEGFGIPIIEAMSCEIPVIATDYTTTPELVLNHNAGLGINLSGVEPVDMFKTNSVEYDYKTLNGTLTGSWEVERGFCSITDACFKVEQIYKNPELARQMGQNGRNAVLKYYDFETIVGPKWENLLNGVL